MPPPEPRRLRRGLEAVSPLFRTAGAAKPAPMAKPVHLNQSRILSVLNAETPADSHFLNALLASQISKFDIACTILTLADGPAYGKPSGSFLGELQQSWMKRPALAARLKRRQVTWDEFAKACQASGDAENKWPAEPRALFLDMDFMAAPDLALLAGLLDKLILLLRPSFESLAETYKMIKWTHALNRETEFFLVFEGSAGDERGSLLFEKLSQMTSRYLGVQLLWLGYLDFAKGVHSLKHDLAVEHLFLNPIRHTGRPEKWALEAHLMNRLGETIQGAA